MILFDLLYQNTDLIFWGFYTGAACFITLSCANALYNHYPIDRTQTTIETPTTDSGVETIRALSSSTVQPSPTLHYFTSDQFRSIMDPSVDGSSEGSVIGKTFVEKGVQTDNLEFKGISLNLNLSPITLDSNLSMLPQPGINLTNEQLELILKDIKDSDAINYFKLNYPCMVEGLTDNEIAKLAYLFLENLI